MRTSVWSWSTVGTVSHPEVCAYYARVRARDPWMLNRAVAQPNPAVFIGMAADTVEAAAEAASPDDLFRRLEEAGVMLRIDRCVTPTMAKTPTLAQWELDDCARSKTSYGSGTSSTWGRPGWC